MTRSIFTALLLLTAPAISAIDQIPIGTGQRTVKEEGIQAPYKETKTYTYAKGIVYNRWIYNPWIKVEEAPEGQKASFLATEQQSGYISAEISAPTTNLDSGKSYTLNAEILFNCASTPETGNEAGANSPSCINELVVRCYGFVDGKWTKTLDEVRRQEDTTKGVFKVGDIKLDNKICARSISMTFKSHLTRDAAFFLFKNMKIGLTPPENVPAKT